MCVVTCKYMVGAAGSGLVTYEEVSLFPFFFPSFLSVSYGTGSEKTVLGTISHNMLGGEASCNNGIFRIFVATLLPWD